MPGKLINRYGRTVVNFDNNSGGGGSGATGATGPVGATGAGATGATGAAGATGPAGAADCINPLNAPYNATGNGVTDDLAALNAAAAAAAAAGLPLCLETPSVAYAVSNTWVIPAGIRVQGTAVDEGQCPIRAIASMTAVVQMRVTAMMGGSQIYGNPCQISGITIDGNGLATYGILRTGDFQSVYTNVFVTGCLKACRFAAAHRLPPTLSAVTPGVGNTSPALTIAVRDPFYGVLDAGVYNIVIKVAPGAITYVLSTDGGVTFSLAQMPLSSGKHNFPQVSPASTKILFDLNVQGTWGAGAFTAGDTWAFTITVGTDDAGSAYCVNGDVQWYNCFGSNSGRVFAVAALAGAYTGLAQSITTVAGTVSTVAQSSIVQGDAFTDFIADGFGPGSMIRIDNSGAAQVDRFWQVVCVLDKATIAVDGLIPFSGSGFNYAVGEGGDYWECDYVEAVRPHANDGFSHHVPVGARYAGSQGPEENLRHYEYCCFVGSIVGGVAVVMHTFQFNSWHCETNGAIHADAIALNISTNVAGGEFIQPPENFSVAMRGQTFVSIAGVKYGIGVGSQIPTSVQSYLQQDVTLTTLGDTLPVPAPASLDNVVSTLQVLHLPSTGLLTAAVPLTDQDGTRVIYRVYAAASKVAVFGDNFVLANKLALEAPFVAVCPGEEIELEQYLGRWWQRGPVRKSMFGLGAFASGDAPGSNVVITTNATPTLGYQFFIGSNTNRIANVAEFDIIGATPDGVTVGIWEDVRVRYAGGASAGNGAQIGTVTTLYQTGTDPGDVPPAGWGFNLTNPVPGTINLNVIGQAATTIHWKVIYRPRTLEFFTA